MNTILWVILISGGCVGVALISAYLKQSKKSKGWK